VGGEIHEFVIPPGEPLIGDEQRTGDVSLKFRLRLCSLRGSGCRPRMRKERGGQKEGLCSRNAEVPLVKLTLSIDFTL